MKYLSDKQLEDSFWEKATTVIGYLLAMIVLSAMVCGAVVIGIALKLDGT